MNINQPRVDLNPHAWAEVARILEHYVPERNVWAFGSRAKWTAKSHSDLDLALIGDEPLPLEKLASLKEAFDESALPFRVDIVDWASTSDSFRKIIERDKVVVQSGKDQANGVAWKSMALEDCLEALIDYRGKTPEKTTAGIPLVTAKVIKAGRIETPTEFIAEEDYETWMRRGIPSVGDVVMTTEAPLGEVAQLGNEKVALAQRVITLRGKENFLDNTYLLYLLQSEEMQEQLKARATGTTVLGIKQSELRKVTLRVPPIAFQRSAAGTLKALDDRITLLRETNATLEAIAQALFKSWFVDFDPVRAKMDGRAPEGMDEGTAALFPDSFEESELGLVPRGWRVGTIGDFARQHKGSINPLKSPDVVFEHFSLPAFDNQQMPVSELGFEIKSNKTSVPPDAVLLSKLNPHIPRIWLPVEVGNHAVCSTEFLVFVPVVDCGGSKEFIYCAFTTDKFKELLCRLVTGTSNSHQRVKPDGVSTMGAVIPSPLALQAFGSLVQPIFQRIGHNRNKIQTLANLRDTLLPRLLSGQLRLPAAQAAAEEALA